jgi:hypothetical protein
MLVAQGLCMKKAWSRLSLRAQTIRLLDQSSLADVVGGSLEPQAGGIIIRPRPTINCPQPSSPSHNSVCDLAD